MITMTYDEWADKYRPQRNPRIPAGSEHAFEGTMYETYGEDIKAIRALNRDPETSWKIWTLIACDEDDDCDDEDESSGLIITNGYHFVNREGYFVTEEPANPKEHYQIDA